MQGMRMVEVAQFTFTPAAGAALAEWGADVIKVEHAVARHGQRGPDAEKGGYDQPTFWCRAGAAWSATPPDCPRVIGMPAGAYGDSIGGMTIAGGIAGALFGRERTGEPSVVDVSLLSVGMW